MDILSPKLHLVALITVTVTSLCAFSHEVTVRSSDLKLCTEDKQVCVTDLGDCGPRPPSSIQKFLNMSCYYEESHGSMTCEWSHESDSHTDSDISLIFSSLYSVDSCYTLFNPSADLIITARIKSHRVVNEIWSKPHSVFLFDAIKPPPPVLSVVGSTDDSIAVSWRSGDDGSCRLRYRVNNTQTWSQVPDLVPAHKGQTLIYTIKGLLPFNTYGAAVSCREESGIWSDWSDGITAKTLDKVPSRPPEVCYRVERTDPGGPLLLHLMWKALDPSDAGGRILGYQVSYRPVKEQQLQDRFTQNVTEVAVPLEVEDGNWSVTVTAFNAAGYGPPAHLRIDTQRQNSVPSVTNMWVSSSFPAVKGLLVQWKIPSDQHSALPVSHFSVQWHAEMHPSTSHWSTVDSSTNSTLIQDVDSDSESYLISVFPVYKHQCGSPQSLPASLEQGALIKVVKLKVIDVTKTLVTVRWTWQRKSGRVRVNRYTVILRRESEIQTLPLWPEQTNHTFPNLTPNTEYSLHLLADNHSINIIPVKTDFDEVPVVASATPLLLLAVIVLIVSILSRTVYKGFFFPHISSPEDSTTGQWLMDPNRQNSTERNILDIKDFQETDVLGVKSAIMVRPKAPLSSEEDLVKDTSLLPLDHLVIKLSDVKVHMDYVSDSPLTTEYQLKSCHPDCAVKCHFSDKMFTCEESREAVLLHHQACDANSWLSQKEEENRQLDCQTSQQAENAPKCCFHELVANIESSCVNQMICEVEYVVNPSFLGKTDVDTVSGQTDCSSLICETNYIANTCFTAKTVHEDRANDVSTAY